MRVERIAIDATLLTPCRQPPMPVHADQRRRAALAIETLGTALADCARQVEEIRAQQLRALDAQ